jgi:glycogen debranching enzyme
MADNENGAAPPRVKRRKLPHGASGDKSPFYIQATSPAADEQARVLKHGDTFGVFDHYGDVKPTGMGEEGLYHEGTRFLSCLLLNLGEERPLFLSSTVKQDNELLTVDLTNPDVFTGDRIAIPRGTLHLFRSKLLWHGVCYERLRVKNYGLAPVQVAFGFHYEADFADIFEVRGTRRPARGNYLPPVVEARRATLSYEGLDGVRRQTQLAFTPQPALLSESEARFAVSLAPQAEATFHLTIACERGSVAPEVFTFEQAAAAATANLKQACSDACIVDSSNEPFNDWVNRAAADLHMMTTRTATGPYPYAGVPWFSTPFGRDGLLTALECLWLWPGLTRGVLSFLAATQADAVNPRQDAEPGKILHEMRDGEMAALGEIPFGRYYGSVDATPLFVLVAGAYYKRTADRPFIESIWPNLERALQWIDTFGDADHDGFVEYSRQSPQGLANQGWKDSGDAIFHADGALAQGSIALCEVQGYVYAAKRAAAALATVVGRPQRAAELEQQASALQERFERAFWCEDLGTFALALDGNKHPCRVRTSNAGHCLFTGIASRERAQRTAQTLLDSNSYSGWGIRTVAASESRFNPMSYHNGSVWPHDNALIALGLARYGLKQAVMQLLNGLLDASLFVDLHRMPELFCGFTRRPGEGPTAYPVACSPQAWAAAAVFAFLQACLGMTVDAPMAQVYFDYPLLPASLKQVRLHNLTVGEASLDLLLVHHGNDVGINVLRRHGDVTICMVK